MHGCAAGRGPGPLVGPLPSTAPRAARWWQNPRNRSNSLTSQDLRQMQPSDRPTADPLKTGVLDFVPVSPGPSRVWDKRPLHA